MRQTLISVQKKCFCARKPEIVFLPPENETVCKNCGMVFEDDGSNDELLSFSDIEQTVPYEMLCKTNLNLHQRKQVGGDPHDEQKVIASSSSSSLSLPWSARFQTYRHRESDQNLLALSDVCRKLSLNSTISEDCWKAFCNDKSHSLTKAKKMCHAIYQTLQNMAIPYDEKTVQEIVCNSLGVKNASDQKGIIFKTDSLLPAFGSKETKRRFYLNVFVQRAQNEHKIHDVSVLRRNSEEYLEDLMMMFPKSDYRTLTKKATDMATMRCINQ